jgi:dolichyl-phosphate beta-glucosyltransferase
MYNEEERVAETLDPLMEFVASKGAGSQLLLVDDGSTDRTVDVVRGQLKRPHCGNADILIRPHAGKGAAIRWGLLHSRTDVAAFCDVDLATPLSELDRIVREAGAGSCLAVGSRATEGAALEQRETRRREIAGRTFNRVVRHSLCGGIKDTQCGAKAAPSAIWRTILVHSSEEGFTWDVEVIALCLRLEIPVREIGITWNHDERTRVRVLRDGMAMVGSVPRIWRRVRRVGPVAQVAPEPQTAPVVLAGAEPPVALEHPVPALAPDTTAATA